MNSLDILKKEIKDYAASIGVDKIGFTGAKPLEMHLEKLLYRQSVRSSNTISEGDPIKRINPGLHLPGAQSVICAAVSYGGKDKPESGRARGRLSFISRGIDYHVVMKEKLELLKEFILKRISDAKILVMVDKEELLEKAFAVEAGLGWLGKNTLLITPEYGSLVFLGELITNIPFSADAPLAEGCGGCERCVSACPTNALDRRRNLNPDLCLAGVSQYKGLINPELRELMGNTIYGCDVCQLVCPHNNKSNAAKHAPAGLNCENLNQDEEHFPVLKEMLSMTNAEFKRKFGHTSGAWRGRTVFQRNAAIAAGNNADQDSVPELIRILKTDNRPVMRATAAWALGKINDTAGQAALVRALSNETDITVISEIRRTLDKKNKGLC